MFLLDLVRFCPSERPAAAKQEINSQPDCSITRRSIFGKTETEEVGGGGSGNRRS